LPQHGRAQPYNEKTGVNRLEVGIEKDGKELEILPQEMHFLASRGTFYPEKAGWHPKLAR
jgi:hypothetical protein